MILPAALGARPLVDIEQTILGMIARDAIKVPPYPAVVLKLREVTARESYGLSDVLAITSSDQVLAGDVLRCANSALYSSGGVTSLQQAVTRIGAKEVVRIAMASSLAANVRTPSSLVTLKRKVWQGSIASALVCEVIGKLRRLPAEDAFLCGLLHDFGWVVGIAAIEEILVGNPDYGARPESFWNTILERWHVRLGLALAARWKLPEVFRDTIWHHHTEEPGDSKHAAMIAVIRASDKVVELIGAYASVGGEELSQIAGLSPAERAALVLALPSLPGLIGAFEQEQAPARVVSMVEAPETTVPAGFRPLQSTVNQVNPGKRGPFGMFGISLNGWVMRGREPLPENQLLEAQVLLEPPLRLWAKTTLCKSEGGGFVIECKPFALNGPAKTVWYALFRKAEAANAPAALPAS